MTRMRRRRDQIEACVRAGERHALAAHRYVQAIARRQFEVAAIHTHAARTFADVHHAEFAPLEEGLPSAEAGSLCTGNATSPPPGIAPPITKRS